MSRCWCSGSGPGLFPPAPEGAAAGPRPVLLRRRVRLAGLVSDGERLGWEWFAREVQPSDLILATAESGNRLPRHVPAHVSAGQWALTPDHLQRAAEAEAFFSGRLDPEEAARYLRDWGVDWVRVGPAERDLGGWVSASFAPGCQLRYKRLGVRIYRCS